MINGKIYKITNTINNKVYIGQTIQKLSTRFSRHKQTHEMRCPHLSNAMDKYGKNNFFIEEIDTAKNKEELNKKEFYWINFYDAVKIINIFNNMKEAARNLGLKSISSRAITLTNNNLDRITNGYKWKKVGKWTALITNEEQLKIEKIIENE